MSIYLFISTLPIYLCLRILYSAILATDYTNLRANIALFNIILYIVIFGDGVFLHFVVPLFSMDARRNLNREVQHTVEKVLEIELGIILF